MPFTVKNLALLIALFGLSIDAQTQTSYGQCAGSGYTGPTLCPASQFCSTENAYYAQCTPGTAPGKTTAHSSITTTTAKPISTTLVASTVKATTTAVSTPPQSGKVQFAGVNIAGCDFGCDTSVSGMKRVLCKQHCRLTTMSAGRLYRHNELPTIGRCSSNATLCHW